MGHGDDEEVIKQIYLKGSASMKIFSVNIRIVHMYFSIGEYSMQGPNVRSIHFHEQCDNCLPPFCSVKFEGFPE